MYHFRFEPKFQITGYGTKTRLRMGLPSQSWQLRGSSSCCRAGER
jgi:hypothetical protein